jgi:hypothetical protein
MAKKNTKTQIEKADNLVEQAIKSIRKDAKEMLENYSQSPKFEKSISKIKRKVFRNISTIGLAAFLGMQSLFGIANAEEAQPKEKPAIEQKQEKEAGKGLELYFNYGYSLLNPTDYNAKLAEVSVGEAFGKATNYTAGFKFIGGGGIGLNLGLEASMSSQTKDAYARNILTGENRKYGENSMRVLSGCLTLEGLANIGGGFRVGFGLAPVLDYIELESKNESNIIKSDPIAQFGYKGYVILKQDIGKTGFFLQAVGEYKKMPDHKVNTEGLSGSVGAGVRF